jgi:hypothetical protein
VDGEQAYHVWAPSHSVWSKWVAPVLFAQITCPDMPANDEAADTSWLPAAMLHGTALILDLPGAKAFRIGLSIAAQRGFRPVPVINSSPGPLDFPEACVIDMRELVSALCTGTEVLPRLNLAYNAPPAFLLDSVRSFGVNPAGGGMFDNRWLVFPQDFPSGAFLTSVGIAEVLLVQEHDLAPQEDLTHILLRWQDAGLRIYSLALQSHDANPKLIAVKHPPRLKTLRYRALATLGLRRSTVGGFGSYWYDGSAFG